MSNQFCCDMCNDVRNPLETDNPKELRHYINLNAQWIVKLENILDNQVHEIESLRYQFDSLKARLIGLSLDDKGRKMFNMWTFTHRTRGSEFFKGLFKKL